MVRAIEVYLKLSASFRKTDCLFVLTEGPRKGQLATSSTISRWIRQIIIQAYGLKRKVPPWDLKAHSTRGVSASWAVRQQVSMAQVCKAAAWSSVHTFTRFYQVDVRSQKETVFGHSVLQAAL